MELTDEQKLALVEALENGGTIRARKHTPPGPGYLWEYCGDGEWALLKSSTLLAQALRSQLPRPMEEAPRDGTEVLLGLDYGARVVGKWNEKHEIWNEPGSVYFAMEQHCVCWWPLPPLPEKST